MNEETPRRFIRIDGAIVNIAQISHIGAEDAYLQVGKEKGADHYYVVTTLTDGSRILSRVMSKAMADSVVDEIWGKLKLTYVYHDYDLAELLK